MLQGDLKHILTMEVAPDIQENIKRSLANTVNWQMLLVVWILQLQTFCFMYFMYMREEVNYEKYKSMDLNLLKTILVLLVLCCLFCLIATTDLGFDPVENVVFYVGGIISIGIATLAALNVFENPGDR